MLANIDSEKKKICGQIEEISYRMIEAEGKEYRKLEKELEDLEFLLSQLGEDNGN